MGRNWYQGIDFHEPHNHERGLLLLTLWAVLVTFGLSMIRRSYRDHGLGWPLRGRMITGIWLLGMSGIFSVSAINFLRPFGLRFGVTDTWPVVYLAVVVGLSIWVWIRWLRYGLAE